MTGKEFNYVRSCIENEGFDYCFVDYGDFKEIKDYKFHKLRIAYIRAQLELAAYIGTDEDE